MYVSTENGEQFYEALSRTMELRYNLWPALRLARSWRQIRRVRNEYASLSKIRYRGARPLIKDPIALFSAEWLASSFGMQVVTMIRHPAAFASSLKRLDWRFPFPDLVKQRSLMEDHLHPFETAINDFASKERDVVEQAALMWKLIHHVIHKYRRNNPDWQFVRHEDLSREPVAGFREIFERLDIEFSDYVREQVIESSHGNNPANAPEGTVHVIKRDSVANIFNWKSSLNAAEIRTIRDGVAEVSELFYADEDW
tara:strand:- start:8274 stop:9038 length:765 start_codon:yes stop_codon:yes gene_type:complete